MDNNSKENIFLGKLNLMLSKFDELDTLTTELTDMIKENPKNQQQIDWILSDFYHTLEDTTTTDAEFINIGKEIQKARIIRNDYLCLYEIIKSYNENKDKLFWCPKHNRDEFKKAIQYAIKYLHEDYKYRVLTEEEIKGFKKPQKEKVITTKSKISKEKLEECLSSGMKGIDIAKMFNVDPSTITRLKSKYGLGTRKYNKRG